MQKEDASYSFCRLKDIACAVCVRIDALESYKKPVPASKLHEDHLLRNFGGGSAANNSDLYVTVELFADRKPLILPVRTSYKSFKVRRNWNEWLTLPIKYSELPSTSQCAITLWDVAGPGKVVPYGGTTVAMFNKDFTLKQGPQKCRVWLDVESDGSPESTTNSFAEIKSESDRLESLWKKKEAGDLPKVDWLDTLTHRQIERIRQEDKSRFDNHYLYIDFVRFDFPIIYTDNEYSKLSGTTTIGALARLHPATVVYDSEILRDNLVEAKHRTLARSHRTGASDVDLKPNAKIRDELNEIVGFSPTQELTNEQKDLVWKFRFYLTREKRALTKVLKSIIWTDPVESRQAIELLGKWTEVEVDDALELLGPTFTNYAVRSYAVDRLRKAGDDELTLYLLQLVQALKYEYIPESTANTAEDSSLASFLVIRAAQSEVLGNDLYWYLMVECESKNAPKLFGKVAYQFMKTLMATPEGQRRRETLRLQAEVVERINRVSKEIKNSRENVTKKQVHLQHLLSDPKTGLNEFRKIPLPLDPKISIVGITASDCGVFKSSLFPLRLVFKCSDGGDYSIIYKNGDDLRQDQLVMQIIMLMDRLLRNENLDLKLSPYRVLATGPDHGAIQYIRSLSLTAALAENNGSLLAFLRTNNPNPDAPLGVDPLAMNTYVKSCAGYCVITYLLGVGDRHLDNLMLSPNGRFFHIDFGFILGHDPKPFPPAMKVSREMVEGMGGQQSIYYQDFKGYCYTAYTTLRKSANLILNLFSLMTDANIPDIQIEPDAAVLKVKEKFCLEMSEGEAMKHFQSLINDSVSALFPLVIDRLHNLTQYWKK